ncbi:hypothetical protein POM88_046499 [Heracleum sosnowskyi]|uniref:Alpha-ketoglutarate-dependent dioxygenase AlkB-like domain-containing protein n=1 Tax=Heracleum sosnowskyi TaxID=360622 RepID=A0AAD8M4R3_9APIA|nr:hypothetical protein POM88_046499 [Heracleum sosnowskyi]
MISGRGRDAKDDKFQIHDHGPGGSSTTKFSRHWDELVARRSTSMDFGKLNLVHDPPVEVFNSLKHLDNQSGSESVNDHRPSTRSKHMVKIVQTCQKLGRGNGGFYQPVFSNGGSVHSKIMCLGKIWVFETKLYAERRAVDGAEPPPIPSEFHNLVQKAIQDAHAYLLKEDKQSHVESVLPLMTPDICVVNFYTTTGRLGLHQVIFTKLGL